MSVRLDEMLNRARLAVLDWGAGLDQMPPALPTIPELVRPLAAPLVVVRSESSPPVFAATSWASWETVVGDAALSKGASRLFSVLHGLALACAVARGYAAVPNQVVFHCPAVMVAAVVGYTDRHQRVLVKELEAAGLLDAGGHAQTGPNGRWMYTGTVWAVKVKPGKVAALVHPDEWKQTWRPEFRADVEGKRGAARLISELVNEQADPEMIYRATLRAAVGNLDYKNPLKSSSEISQDEAMKTVQDVVYVLGSGGLLALTPAKRGHLISLMADVLGRCLDGGLRWRRWYAGTILDALEAEEQGRPGLQALAAALSRIDADVREGAPWERPGAVLAARLRVVA